MALTEDILAKIRQDFSRGEILPVIEMMTRLQEEDAGLFTDRILRCVLFVASGRFGALADAVALARLDYRDLIVNAEYDGHFGALQRDLSLPFPALHRMAAPPRSSAIRESRKGRHR
jgi:hypothetical protein